MQRVGERIRVQTQVIRPDPEEHLLAETFERPQREVLALHDAVARSIATAVRAPILPAEELRMASTGTVDPAAYEAYLQGRYWAGKFEAADLLKAKGYLERAVALDAGFAPAWTSLAETLIWLGRYHTNTEDAMTEAEAAARRALQIDGNQARAYAVLSGVAQGRWQWQEAEEHARHAIELDPNSADARRSYWRILAPQARWAEARRQIDLAVRLDPLSAQMTSNLGLQLVFERRYDEAERVLKHALELDRDFTLSHAWLWIVYTKKRQDPERGQELARYLEAVNLGQAVPELERELAGSGYEAALRAIALRLSAEYAGDPAQVGIISGLLAEAGKSEEALKWLRLGLERRIWDLPWQAVTPDLENLRGLPEYRRIIAATGLPNADL